MTAVASDEHNCASFGSMAGSFRTKSILKPRDWMALLMRFFTIMTKVGVMTSNAGRLTSDVAIEV